VVGFFLTQAIAVPKRHDPLYISKINTGMQITLVGFVLARLGLGAAPGWLDLTLSLAVAATTLASGVGYLIRWTRILAGFEPTLCTLDGLARAGWEHYSRRMIQLPLDLRSRPSFARSDFLSSDR